MFVLVGEPMIPPVAFFRNRWCTCCFQVRFSCHAGVLCGGHCRDAFACCPCCCHFRRSVALVVVPTVFATPSGGTVCSRFSCDSLVCVPVFALASGAKSGCLMCPPYLRYPKTSADLACPLSTTAASLPAGRNTSFRQRIMAHVPRRGSIRRMCSYI